MAAGFSQPFTSFDSLYRRTEAMTHNGRLWIALTRPDNLVTALAAVTVARKYFCSCNLIYEESEWWQKAKWDTYRSCFDEVHPVRKVPTCRGLGDVARLSRALRERQRHLSALPIASEDTIFLLAGITVLSNALASAYPQVYKVLCTTVQKYGEASHRVTFRRYRHTTSSWLQNHFLEPKAGLHRTLNLKPWFGRGDGVRIKRLVAPLEKVFDCLLLLSNDGYERPVGAEQAQLSRFPRLSELSGIFPSAGEGIGVGHRVIFCGTPFLLVRNLPTETYVTQLNACLDYLRRCYPTPYQLIYRPHPAETNESGRLRLDRFAVERDGEVAELYFLRHAREIAAVFSVSSTVSRVAFNYGLNAYAFWPSFPFAPKAAAFFDQVIGQVPAEFNLGSLERSPRPYQAEQPVVPESRSFSEAFAEIVGRRSRKEASSHAQ